MRANLAPIALENGACDTTETLTPPAAPVGTKTAQDILAMGVAEGKWRRDAFYKAVHEFRDAHGFEPGHGTKYTARYAAALDHYCSRIDECADKDAIERLATPRLYEDIRQAGRMRAYREPVSDEVADALCREIKAAFVWRSLAKYGAQES